MTAVERSLLRCVETVQAAFATGSTFTLDGNSTVFSGIINEEPNLLSIVPGGTATDLSLTIEATRQQFADAGVEPERGGSLHYGGRRYIITAMPGYASDETSYRMVCEAPQQGRSR